MPQAEKAEKPVRELLQEQSEELKSYIDRKHREMEELHRREKSFMPAKENIQTRWSDRSRIFGLPITFTKYSMSDDRIFCEKGLLNMKFEEILLYRVRDISMKITLGQRIFGVGSILLQSSDKTAPVLEIKNVKNPRQVKEMIHQQVEQVKEQRRMRFGEVLEDPTDDMPDFLE